METTMTFEYAPAPESRATDMSLVEEDAVNNAFNCLIDWSIIKDNIGSFAT